jgi:hypothetical protein
LPYRVFTVACRCGFKTFILPITYIIGEILELK